MQLGEINSIRLRLTGIRTDLVNQLRSETDPSDVIALISALDDVRDIADDIHMDLTPDHDKMVLAARSIA